MTSNALHAGAKNPPTTTTQRHQHTHQLPKDCFIRTAASTQREWGSREHNTREKRASQKVQAGTHKLQYCIKHDNNCNTKTEASSVSFKLLNFVIIHNLNKRREGRSYNSGTTVVGGRLSHLYYFPRIINRHSQDETSCQTINPRRGGHEDRWPYSYPHPFRFCAPLQEGGGMTPSSVVDCTVRCRSEVQ